MSEPDIIPDVFKAIIGEYAVSESAPGVYKWTFTPPTTQSEDVTPDSIIEALEKVGYKCIHGMWISPYILSQIRPQPTADELYEQWRERDKAALMARLEESAQTMQRASNPLRYYDWYAPLGIPPAALRSLPSSLSTSQLYALNCALPQLSAVETHKAINRMLCNVNYNKAMRRSRCALLARQHKRRQHRAAFRRRKRGLA